MGGWWSRILTLSYSLKCVIFCHPSSKINPHRVFNVEKRSLKTNKPRSPRPLDPSIDPSMQKAILPLSHFITRARVVQQYRHFLKGVRSIRQRDEALGLDILGRVRSEFKAPAGDVRQRLAFGKRQLDLVQVHFFLCSEVMCQCSSHKALSAGSSRS